MSDLSSKKPITTTQEVAKMLGLHSSETSHEHSLSVGNLPVKDLPVVGFSHGGKAHAEPAVSHKENYAGNSSHGLAKQINILRVLRALTPYLAIFTLGIFLYFFFFTGVNINLARVFRSQARVNSSQQSALEQLQKQNLEGYNKWIAQFYYDVSNTKVLDPDVDNSGNGLTNFQKYLLNLNPKSYDTLGLGMADSEALAKGISPVTGNSLNETQKQIVERYFDMEVAMNRLALAHLQSTRVAGANTFGYGNFDNSQTTQDSNQQAQNFVSAPLSGQLDIDQKVPGRLEVPSLKIDVPIIWTQDTKNFDADLRNGVVHYPNTAMPGQIGTSYISGHSSNYVWAKGSYNQIFSTLGDLADNTSFKVTVTLKGGKQAVLYYVVVGRQQYSAKDQAQFTNSGKSVMALSTCWPVGSTAKRLVVFGELTQLQEN